MQAMPCPRLPPGVLAPVLLTAALLGVYWVKPPAVLPGTARARKGTKKDPNTKQDASTKQAVVDSRFFLPKPEGSPGNASRPANTSSLALHIHFNGNQHWRGIFWFLNQTELCHPRNFMFCAFVSDWSRLGNSGPPHLPSHSRAGVPLELMDCPVNGESVPPTGRYQYLCFAKTLEVAVALGAAGLFIMGDDLVLLKPWREIMPRLLAGRRAVMPYAYNNVRCDVRSESYCDAWLPLERSGLIRALETLSPPEKLTLNVTPGPVFVQKTMPDAAYLPASFVKSFRRAAEHFYRHRVFVEWCLVPMAELAGGVEQPGAQNLGGIPLWGSDRDKSPKVAKEESRKGRLAFLHAMKLTAFPLELEELHRAAFGP